MDRKEFFKKLVLGGAGFIIMPGKLEAIEPKKQKIRLAVVFIAGFDRYDGPEVENIIETGMPLQLNRQPHNQYDKNAIEVYSGDAKLGYLPRKENKPIAELMDQGFEVEAEITELNPEAFPYGSVKVEVFYWRELET